MSEQDSWVIPIVKRNGAVEDNGNLRAQTMKMYGKSGYVYAKVSVRMYLLIPRQIVKDQCVPNSSLDLQSVG